MSKDQPLYYRPDIDGLRAISVVAVLLYHFFPSFLPGGYLGVDIFFVISGFLITGIILNGFDRQDFKFLDFYSKRVRRIFPALNLVLLSVIFFGWNLLLPDEFSALGRQIVSSVLFVPNVNFWLESGNYFDSSSDLKPLLHLWSLGIEEQFYFLWPGILSLCIGWRKKTLIPLIILLLGLSFSLNLIDSFGSSISRFYLLQFRAWELLAGGLTAAYIRKPSSSVDFKLLAPFGILLIFISFFIPRMPEFGVIQFVPPVLGATFVILGKKSKLINIRILSSHYFVLVGLISYPLYLWHWPFLVFLKTMIADGPSVTLKFITIVLCFLISFATYKYIETPFRSSNSQRSIFFLIGLFILSGIFGWAMLHHIFPPYSQRYPISNIKEAISDWAWPSPDLELEKKDSNVFYRVGSGATKILFFGDSNMQQYSPRIEKILKEKKVFTGVFATVGGCAPIPNVRELGTEKCDHFVDEAMNYVSTSEISTIVIAASWDSYFNLNSFRYFDEQKSYNLEMNSEGSHHAFRSLASMIQMFTSKGIRTYLVLNIPRSDSADPRKMIKRSFVFDFENQTNLRGFSKKFYIEKYGAIRNSLIRAAEISGASVIDPVEFLCDDELCLSMTDSLEPIYKDRDHLRSQFVSSRLFYLDFIFTEPKK